MKIDENLWKLKSVDENWGGGKPVHPTTAEVVF